MKKEINQYHYEQMNRNLIESKNLALELERYNANLKEENMRLKREFALICDQITLKEKAYFALQAEKKINEENMNSKYNELQRQLDEKHKECVRLEEKYELNDRELKEEIKVL